MIPLILPSFPWFIQLLVFVRFVHTLRCPPWPPKTTSRSSRRASQRHNRNAHHLAPLDVILLLRPTVPLFQLSGDLFIWPPSIVATHLGLYAHLDSTEIANDAAVNISTYHAVELRCAIATVSSTALPSGTTNVLSTATTSSWIHNTATIHYYLAEITLTNHTTFSFSDQQIKGYPVRPCEIPAMPHWKPDVDFHDAGRRTASTFRLQYAPESSRSTRTLKEWTLCKFPYGNSSIKV